MRRPLALFRRFAPLAWGFAAVSGVAAVAPAIHAAEQGGVVALPPFMVEEASKGPPWRYARTLDFEILSRCDDPTTRQLTEIYYRLHRLLALVVPPSLQVRQDVQKTVIYYDEELKPAASQEVISQMLKRSSAIPVVEAPAGFGGRDFRGNGAAPRQYTFLPNMRLWDKDAMAIFAIVRRGELDGENMFLTADYVAYLLKNRTPSLPTWFIAGLMGLYPDLKFRGETLHLGEGEWISPAETRLLKNDPKTARPLLPIGAFLRGDAPANYQTKEDNFRVWSSQAELFVRWGLDPQVAGRREGFWKFVEQSAASGGSEKLLQECLGLDFAVLEAQLAAFLPAAVRKPVTFHLPATHRMPALVLRNATDGEIARIKGDWERLEIAYVRKHHPEVADKYIEQARRTLLRAYDRDVRDPLLLASLGLCEIDAGNDAAARGYLETAAKLEVVRPRAWYELARLRLAEHLAAPASQGKLTAEQAADVLTPLFAARKQNPPMPEVYEMIAEVWERCTYAPKKGHLAVLSEGVDLFPRQLSLLRRVAPLYLAVGAVDEAGFFVELGRRLAAEEKDRTYFAELQARLPAAIAK